MKQIVSNILDNSSSLDEQTLYELKMIFWNVGYYGMESDLRDVSSQILDYLDEWTSDYTVLDDQLSQYLIDITFSSIELLKLITD